MTTQKIHPENKTENENMFTEDIESFKKHNFYKIIKYVSHKFPSFLLFIHICISKYIFICDQKTISKVNSTKVTIHYKNENNIPLYQFWIYIIIISVLCFTWECVYKYFRYKRKNKNYKTNYYIYYILIIYKFIGIFKYHFLLR